MSNKKCPMCLGSGLCGGVSGLHKESAIKHPKKQSIQNKLKNLEKARAIKASKLAKKKAGKK